MKRIIFIIVMLAMMGILLAQGTPGLEYKLINGGKAYAVSKGTATAKEVVIPASYNGLPVTEIGSPGFREYTDLTSITIPSSVTNIEGLAFWKCTSLTSINIPNSVTSIGEAAFSNCHSLKSITIPNSVTNIGYYVFIGCTSLTINVAASSKPAGWDDKWNPSNRPVVWGVNVPQSTYAQGNKPKYNCDDCKDTKLVTCTGCRGTGRSDNCYMCSGTGSIPVPTVDAWTMQMRYTSIACVNGSDGKMPCFSCSYSGTKGKVTCRSCYVPPPSSAPVYYQYTAPQTLPSSSGSSGSSSSSRPPQICTSCNGIGKIPDRDVPDYGLNNVYCETCRKTYVGRHTHRNCYSCNGTGYR